MNIQPASILIVDDDEQIRRMFEIALNKAGFQCRVSGNARDALAALAVDQYDVVISDIDMPGMDGIELSKRILEKYQSDIIIMTGKLKTNRYEEVIQIGGSDFVEKPFSIHELVLRINRVLRERRLRLEARRTHEELQKAYIDSIHRLVMASEFKDEDTGDHIVRIGEYCLLMAKKIGWSARDVEAIGYAAPMHDVGKIGIPDKILLKPGKLSTEEFEVMKTHTTIGAQLLSRSKSGILEMAREIALTHHERYDGQGYPNGLKGKDIPLSGRIVSIVDAFDALTSKRPYKDPYPPHIALDVIRNEKGRHFDPGLTDLFITCFSEFLKIRETIGSFEEVTLENFMLSERDKTGLGV